MVPSGIEFTVAFGGSDWQTPPVIVTRAVDVPVARFAALQEGIPLDDQPTTNQIGLQRINLGSQQPAGAGTGPE
jgi:hypothetical protein